jgi:D-alanyl-D-alanine carboxypeptidase
MIIAWKKYKVWIVSIALVLCIVFAGMLGYMVWVNANQSNDAVLADAQSLRDENEVNFIWKTLVLNGIVVDKPTLLSTKQAKLNEISKTNTIIIQKLAHTLNKYAALFGAEWYTTKSTIYTRFVTASYQEKILLSSSLTTYTKELKQDIITRLKERNNLVQIDFETFDKYILVIDSRYVEYVSKFFDEDSTTKSVYYSPLFDTIIAELSQARGYTLKKTVPSKDLVTAKDGWALRQGVREQFDLMQKEAQKSNINFDLISTYRSVEEQKELFDQELVSYGINLNRLSDEVYVNSTTTRDLIQKALNRVAPPGYSKHHTGVTFDLVSSEARDFGNTQAYLWLSQDNYYNAKKFGFLPSYPQLEEIAKYGPNPEAWEYFYVGKDGVIDYQ